MIEKQKEVAKKVYSMLSLADPDCVLAEGAARDWYFNEPANDLDFYFCSTAMTMGRTKFQLEAVGFAEVKHVANPHTSELYKSMNGLVRIWECALDGFKVQMIQMADAKCRWKVVENMDISICKAYVRKDMSIVLSEDFKITVASGIMFLKDGYEWDQKHAVKMKERFTNKFSCGTKQTAISRIVRLKLGEVV